MKYYVRPENRTQDRIGQTLGPFAQLQLDHNVLKAEDVVAAYYQNGYWHVTQQFGPAVEEWTDLIIWAEEGGPTQDDSFGFPDVSKFTEAS